MKVRLIKPDLSAAKPKAKRPADQVQAIDRIKSWVDEFKLRKADETKSESRRLRQVGESR